MLHVGEVISDKCPTCLAVEADVVFAALLVLGFRTREGEVDGEALAGLGSSASGVVTGSFLGLFGTNAGGTLVEDGVHVFELGDAFDMFVGVVQIVVAGMAKAVVPKEAFSGGANGIDRGVLLDAFVEG